jgi:MGT family glycosyltransferase
VGRRHIAIFNIPAPGHINPTLAIVSELIHRGYEVSYSAVDRFARIIADAGAKPIIYPSTYLTKAPPDPFTLDDATQVMVEGVEDAIAAFQRCAEFYRDQRPDLIIYDGLAYAGRIASLCWNIPAIRLHPNFADNEHFCYLKSSLGTALAPLTESSKVLEAFLRANHIDNPDGDYFEYVEKRHIVFFPKVFQLHAETFDERFHFVGPCLGERAFYGQWQPPVSQRPVLLISLGTNYNAWTDFYKMCIEAFGPLDWQVVVTVGQHLDIASLGNVPANIEIRPFAPHLEILKYARMFIGHGGMNSTMEALYSGVPMLLIPQMTDEDLIAGQVEKLGVGKMLKKADVTVQALQDRVIAISTDLAIQKNVAAMRETIKTAGGVDAAVDFIEATLLATDTVAQRHGVAGQ